MKKSDLNKKLDKLHELFSFNDVSSREIQLKLVYDICENEVEGLENLLLILLTRRTAGQKVNYVDGLIFELLMKSNDLSIVNQLNDEYPLGIVPLKSDINMDYSSLQKLLVDKKFQDADKLTQIKLCELSQVVNEHSRPWLYFTDISSLPCTDLKTIDQLWQVHSKGLFGVSVQRKIWLANDNNWEKFWNKIGWKINNVACRYPQEFIWNISAPAGHLPLFNQLRGVQVLAALFRHPVWVEVSDV